MVAAPEPAVGEWPKQAPFHEQGGWSNKSSGIVLSVLIQVLQRTHQDSNAL